MYGVFGRCNRGSAMGVSSDTILDDEAAALGGNKSTQRPIKSNASASPALAKQARQITTFVPECIDSSQNSLPRKIVLLISA
jgi:hypothetical protein